FYRISIITLFISFTYIELMDKSTYLNHYYFISVISFMMIFLPAHAYFSLDTILGRQKVSSTVPQWSIDCIKFMVCIVYFYAGLAKVNSDWLLEALPLKIWLPAKNDMPIIGPWLNFTWVHYAFSWFGCVYDLSIPFLLWNRKTRPWAYIAVIVFHVATAILFPIGVFPFVMIVTALIFFSPGFHQNIIEYLSRKLRIPDKFIHPNPSITATNRWIPITIVLFLGIQLIVPFRYFMYPNELFWTEQGYRFSWRVMLMEKAGYVQFTVKDDRGNRVIVNNNEFLSPLQEKMMSTQPDMILQFAHILKDYYATHGFHSPQVYADTYVALNGRMGKPLIDPAVDLAKEKDSFKNKTWILPFGDEIKGF
ncbi:MAG: HTTM domain-containing protein, partial [Cytophagales bacterium]|nr:HTTM domain-containing protein [Cytophagales bacterium]